MDEGKPPFPMGGTPIDMDPQETSEGQETQGEKRHVGARNQDEDHDQEQHTQEGSNNQAQTFLTAMEGDNNDPKKDEKQGRDQVGGSNQQEEKEEEKEEEKDEEMEDTR